MMLVLSCGLLTSLWSQLGAKRATFFLPAFRSGSSKYTTVSATRSQSALSSRSASAFDDHDEIPTEFPRRNDVLVALSAVRKACVVTERLQPDSKEGIGTVAKADLSPVTVADYAAQAIVLQNLHEAFPNDSFIAEESSEALDDQKELAQAILNAVEFETLQHVKQSIDLGKSYLAWENNGGRPPRVWCLDPIDGTKGFLRGKRQGGQYAVALALLEEGVPTIGILGCPNLPVSVDDVSYEWDETETGENNIEKRGCIFVASKGGGCLQLPLVPGLPAESVHVTPNDCSTMKVEDARFCVGVEKGIADALGQCSTMAEILHGKGALDSQGEIVKAHRIDSQAKYAVLARGGSEYYVRLPQPGYVEWVWDHAAGSVVIEEAGGRMSDIHGDNLDFSVGPKLSKNVGGILGSNGGEFHDALLKAYQQSSC